MKDHEELLEAYNVLVAFQLWRRGAIEGAFTDNEKTIGEAIDTACGALWCIVNGESGMTLEKRLEIAEKLLKSCESANEYLKKELDKAEHEIKLAKKEIVDICTRHNIRYYMDEHNRLFEMQDKTYAERVHAAQEDDDADPTL